MSREGSRQWGESVAEMREGGRLREVMQFTVAVTARCLCVLVDVCCDCVSDFDMALSRCGPTDSTGWTADESDDDDDESLTADMTSSADRGAAGGGGNTLRRQEDNQQNQQTARRTAVESTATGTSRQQAADQSLRWAAMRSAVMDKQQQRSHATVVR